MSPNRTLPAGLLALVYLSGAYAQTAENLVVTATRSERDPLTLSSNIARLDERALQITAATHPHEFAVQVPGAWISRNSGQEQLTALRSPVLTGAGSCGAFLILEDGIATRPTGFCNVNQLFEVPTEMARSIEVIRGPANAWYGSNGLHGTINTLLPQPGGARQTALTVEAGSNEFWRGQLRYDTGGDEASYSSGLMLDHDGGYRDESGYEQIKAFLKGRYLRETGTLEFGVSISDLDQETAGFITGERAYEDDDRFSNPNPEAFRKASSQRFSLTWTPDTDGRWSRNWRTYLRHSDMEFLQHFLPGQPLEENNQISGGVLFNTRYQLANGGEWSLGFDSEIAQGELKETQDGPAEGNAFIMATRPEGKHYDYRVDSVLVAGYTELRWPLAERLELQAGARWEYLGYDYDNLMVSGNTRDDGVTECGFGGCQYSRPEDRKDNFRNFAPNIGLLYRLNDQTSLFASAKRGFRAPQATELYRLQRNQEVADINSEELDAVEIGVRHRGPGLALELTGYVMRKKNFIFRDATDSNVSNGKTKHIGVELGAEWRPVDNWYLSVTASHSEQEYRFTQSADLGEEIRYGNEIDTAPQTLASARVGYDYLRGQVELEWVYQDAYWMDAANTTRYEGHDLLNLRLLFDVTESVTAGLRLNNLTDEVYADRADLLSITPPGTERYFPGRSREIYASLRWQIN